MPGADPGLTKDALLQDLRALGIRAGDTAMLHASLRKIGLASRQPGCGADLLLDALDEAVGPEGTLLMVLGAEGVPEWVGEPPRPEQVAAGTGEPFDSLTTPALEEVGWLAEAFRRRPGTIVTDNPSGRFGARGRRSEELLSDVPWHDYYGPGSPLDRLCRAGGRILRMGPNLDTVTALHFAEYLADLPHKKRVRRHFLVRGADQPKLVTVECLEDEYGIVDREGEDYFALILKAHLAAGRASSGRVGGAQSELIDADDLVRFGARWMERHLS